MKCKVCDARKYIYFLCILKFPSSLPFETDYGVWEHSIDGCMVLDVVDVRWMLSLPPLPLLRVLFNCLMITLGGPSPTF